MITFKFTLGKITSPERVEPYKQVRVQAVNKYDAQIKLAEVMTAKYRSTGLTVLSSEYYHKLLKEFRPVYIPFLQENLFCFIGN